jgi:hypothetical protein
MNELRIVEILKLTNKVININSKIKERKIRYTI